MKDYKIRFINEYKELKEKYDKLHKLLIKYEAGTLNFKPTCSLELLKEQASYNERIPYKGKIKMLSYW